jgi:hypothetical protein
MVFGNLNSLQHKRGWAVLDHAMPIYGGAADKAVLFAARSRHFVFVGLLRTWLGQLLTFDIAEFQDLPPSKLYLN